MLKYRNVTVTDALDTLIEQPSQILYEHIWSITGHI